MAYPYYHSYIPYTPFIPYQQQHIISTSPPFSTFNEHSSYPHYQPQSQDFYSQLETLKQYLIETHEIKKKSREELQEQIQNLSLSLKASSQKFSQIFSDAQKKDRKKYQKVTIDNEPEKRVDEKQVEEESEIKIITLEKKSFPMTSLVSSPATFSKPARSLTSLSETSPTPLSTIFMVSSPPIKQLDLKLTHMISYLIGRPLLDKKRKKFVQLSVPLFPPPKPPDLQSSSELSPPISSPTLLISLRRPPPKPPDMPTPPINALSF
ncbi:uncharacterized protein LOC131649427 [Vicia villosa]|uniref:uncharacterized protein LOC131649427 n=1 Tax=Vicia villosa TaxID=3911 RepID=UPI00273A878C|nr:uncharacterized protein LOC131649427 [Vicia villosa]